MDNFVAHSETERREMLNEIGISSVADLFSRIPDEAKMGNFGFEKPLSELQVQQKIKKLASKNKIDYVSFIDDKSLLFSCKNYII